MSESGPEELTAEEALRELLQEIATGLGLEAEIEIRQRDGVLVGDVRGAELGLLIGRRGQTIDAVQHLAQRMVFPGARPEMRVVVDADGYRERRAVALQADATAAAESAVRGGEPVQLEPMAAGERRVVHEFLRDRGDVETHSEGDEPARFLVVSPLKAG